MKGVLRMCRFHCRTCGKKYIRFLVNDKIKCRYCGQVTYIKKQGILKWVQGILVASFTFFVSSYSGYFEKKLNLPIYVNLIIFIVLGVIFIDSIYSVVVAIMYNKRMMKYFLEDHSKKQIEPDCESLEKKSNC